MLLVRWLISRTRRTFCSDTTEFQDSRAGVSNGHPLSKDAWCSHQISLRSICVGGFVGLGDEVGNKASQLHECAVQVRGLKAVGHGIARGHGCFAGG